MVVFPIKLPVATFQQNLRGGGESTRPATVPIHLVTIPTPR